jgi:hypothetical protein
MRRRILALQHLGMKRRGELLFAGIVKKRRLLPQLSGAP